MIDIEKLENLAYAAAAVKSSGDILDGAQPYHVLRGPDGGHQLLSAEPFLPAPARIRRHIGLETVEAFLEYHQKWELPDTELFACRDSVSFQAIIDAPSANGGGDGVQGQHVPSWTDHLALYTCPYSREWLAWTENDRAKLSQVDFAEFLEDHVLDVQSPTGGELLDLCSQLQIIRRATFAQGTVLASGEHNLTYSENNEPGTVEIPSQITLGIPIFRGGDVYAVKARFKYRLSNGQLVLFYELVQPEKYVDDAFAAIEDRIANETEEPVLRVTQLP